MLIAIQFTFTRAIQFRVISNKIYKSTKDSVAHHGMATMGWPLWNGYFEKMKVKKDDSDIITHFFNAQYF